MAYRDLVGIPDASKANINSLAINSPDAASLATHAASTSAHNLGATWEEKYVARGLSRSGLTVGQAGVFFEDFTDIARWQQTMGVASLTALTTNAGGVGQIAAGIGDTVDYYPGDAAFGSSTVVAGRQCWYMAARMKVLAVPGAFEAADVSLRNPISTDQISMGCDLNVDITFWSFFGQGDGGGGSDALVSTVALDINWHDLESWSDGTRYYFAVDGEAPLSIVPTAIFNNQLIPSLWVIGDAAGITPQYDKALWIFPQAA
jgi:hypothetical protein